MNWPGASIAEVAAVLIAAIKLTIILGVPWMVAAMLSRQSAAKRHSVWVAAVVAALLLPVFVYLTPFQYSGSFGHAASHLVSQVAAPAGDAPGAMPAAIAAPRAHPRVSLVSTLGLIWLAGFLVLALRLLAGMRRLAKIGASAKAIGDSRGDSAFAALIRELAGSLDVHRPVRVLLCRNPAFIPITWGAVHPRIALPADAARWSAERRRIVLAHELAHIGRNDWLMQMCAEVMCCVYWFHHFAWVAARELRQQSEQACDDAVLRINVPPAEYANELLELVQTLGTAGGRQAPALAIVRFRDLERRFEAMVANTMDRSRLSKRVGALVAVATLLLVLPLAAFRLPAQPEAGNAPHGWFLTGSAAANYTTGVDPQMSYQGHASAFLKAKPAADKGFGTLAQGFAADQYLGHRVRLSANVKSDAVEDWAGLWMRVDQGSTVVAFDNMQRRAIKGTTDWQNYSVVLDVPKDATGISVGALLTRGGTIWINNVKVEIVGEDVQVTNIPAHKLPPGPTNLSFDN
jgi:beta-lactamase regulating signal transducer with metallopeptidase domain